MDRGGSVKDYIRNGEEEGFVEIDLNMPMTSKGFVTIKRHMKRSDVGHVEAPDLLEGLL
jgi:hypothetical protein